MAFENIEIKEFDSKIWNIEIFTTIWEIYLSSFPEIERISKNMLISRIKQGKERIFYILLEKHICGICFLFQTGKSNNILLDYIAIKPEFQKNKLGTTLLQFILKKYQSDFPNAVIFAEVEKLHVDGKESLIQGRRYNWYLNMGFIHIDNLSYKIPNLSKLALVDSSLQSKWLETDFSAQEMYLLYFSLNSEINMKDMIENFLDKLFPSIYLLDHKCPFITEIVNSFE